MATKKRSKYALLRALKFQNIVLKHQKCGATQTWIYENIVKPDYPISKSTFDRYMAINAKKLLKDLEKEEK